MARFGRGLICMPMTADPSPRARPSAHDQPEHGVHGHGLYGIRGCQSQYHHRHLGFRSIDYGTCSNRSGDEAGPTLSLPAISFPLQAKEGGVLQRTGHTEACVDLARLAGLEPAGVIVEIMNDDGTMARLPELECFAEEHGIRMVTIERLITLSHAVREAGTQGLGCEHAHGVR